MLGMIKYPTLKGCLHNLSIALFAIAGVYILYGGRGIFKHWYHIPKPYSNMLEFLWWALLLLWCLYICKIRLSAKGRELSRAVILRSLLTGLVFAIIASNYNPQNYDNSYYWVINSIGYATLLYALFSITFFRRCCAAVGKLVLGLLRLSGFYWCALATIFVFGMAYYLSGDMFEHVPILYDSIAQLIHAKFMAQGHWYGTSNPLSYFFSTWYMINNGKWYSQYPPGHIMLLAIGTALHHVEMVNPLIGACTCIAVWLLAKELYGSHVAKIAVFLSALCVYMIIMSSEYMSHATSLLTGTLFLWGYFRVLHRHGCRSALAAGAALGYCFIARPYSAFGLAIPAAVYAPYLIITKPRTYLAPMMCMGGIFACFVAFQLYYNAITTGNPLLYGYEKSIGHVQNPLSYEAIQKLTPHVLYLTLHSDLVRVASFNRILFEWPLPALALVALLFSIRGQRWDEKLLLYTLFSVFISLLFCWYAGDWGWGPRLLYDTIGILIVCCAKAVSLLPPLLRKLSLRRYSLSFYYGSGAIILASFYVVAFQHNLNTKTIKDMYDLNNRESNARFYDYLMENVNPPALVFVSPNTYKYVAFTNPPDEEKPVIFAIDASIAKDEKLMKQYPKRNVYLVIKNDIIKVPERNFNVIIQQIQ